ncbi:MAG: DUF4058 family protein [Chloroflexi bacterium]|nr:DUF4058 family protein [Chloroflexota bacterium]
MPSPFPGMDPYLEGDLWQEFHERLAGAISARLMRLLPRTYVALLAKRYVLDRSALGIVALRPEQVTRVVYPDVHVATTAPVSAPPTAGSAGGAVALAEPAVELPSALPEQVPLLSVEVRDVAQRRLVTAIEILSPVNKEGDGAREYDERRTALLETRTHLLEIDLLRRGQRVRLLGEPPPAPWYVYLSRVQRRPLTAVWPVPLRARLPAVPVPLLEPDPDAPLDLQAAVDDCFAIVGYERLLDYTGPPPPPPLPPEDMAWIEQVLRAAGYR